MNELEKAVELAENGWCMGNLLDEDGKVCAAGAIYAAHKGYEVGMLANLDIGAQIEFEREAAHYVNDSEAGKALKDEIMEQGKGGRNHSDAMPYSVVWQFNDHWAEGTANLDFNDDALVESLVEAHKYDVLEMMKRAAKRL